MKFGKGRRRYLAGALEKLGVAGVVASFGDLLIAHRLTWATDLAGIALGLLFIAIGVMLYPDE